MTMKKQLLTLVMLIVVVGMGRAQDKLVKVNADFFEKYAEKAAKDKKLDLVMASWAKDVFNKYCDDKKIIVSFTEADYKALTDSIANYIPKLNNLDKDKENLGKQITNLQSQLEEQIQRANELDSIVKAQQEDLKKLQADAQKLDDEKSQFDSEKDVLNRAMKDLSLNNEALKKERNDLKRQNDSLLLVLGQQNKEVAELNSSIGSYETAIRNTKDTINRIYEANKNISVMAMKTDDMKRANEAFTSMASLLQIDKNSYNDLQEKINDMANWQTLGKALNEGIKYMKGKYDEKTRQDCLKAIQSAMYKANLSVSQQSESQTIVNALTNQIEVQRKFTALMNDLINNTYLLETSRDASKVLEKINKMEADLRGKLCDYHVMHNEAIYAMRDLFKNAEDDFSYKKLNTMKGFENAINEIKAIYQ